MLRASLEEAHGEIETFKFAGESVDLASVLDECRSFGLMATHKLVIVDDADQFVKADTRPMLERYCEQPSEQATLVLRGSKWNKGKLDDAISKVGLMLKCDAVDEGTAVRWTQARAGKAYESSIDPSSASALVERLGADLGRIDTELAKLATAAGKGNPITQELVRELVGMTREDDVWAIQSYLLCGDASKTLHELQIIMNGSSKGAHVPVSFACTDLARKLMGIAEGMSQGINPNTLAKEMKLWGPSRDPIMQTARRIGAKRARSLFDECIEADMALKSSKGTPMRTLEMLTLSFARASR
jgi:DNA polymerase III subunit delta